MITVRATEEPDDSMLLHVAVTDTGVGIPADRMDRLFRSFSQVETSTTRRYGGTGLGLAISARLVAAMGGRIAVDSEPGHGSTFGFSIPIARADRLLTHVGRDRDLRGMHALVVDDNADNRRILQRQLQSWGATSDAADGGAAALALAAQDRRYDVGVLDLDMPGVDGVDLAVALHGLPGYADLPLVLLSPMSGRRDRSGYEHFAAQLVKPAKSVQLHRALARIGGRTLPEWGLGRGTAPRRPASPLRVLLVEYNAVNQKIAVLMLQRLGYPTDVAGNGLQALAAVRDACYDVVLMDVQMPEMDGLEASRRIRAELALPRQPTIIAMTANAMIEDRTECFDAGMDSYLAKPVRLEQLAAALADCTPAGPLTSLAGPLAAWWPDESVVARHN